MGTVPKGRRRGIGERTLTAALASAAEDGAARVRLEVIEGNAPAIALYEKLGFAVTRRLLVTTLRALGAPDSGWRALPVADARAWIAAHRAGPEPWQRDDAFLDHARAGGLALTAVGADDGGELIAAAICVPEPTVTRVIQMGARDAPAALEALRAVAAAAPGNPVRLSNFPLGEPVAAAITELSTPDLVQYEMALALTR